LKASYDKTPFSIFEESTDNDIAETGCIDANFHEITFSGACFQKNSLDPLLYSNAMSLFSNATSFLSNAMSFFSKLTP